VATMASGGRDLSRRFPGVDEIFDPTWSPDGRYIAFSGLAGGQSDLFVYDTALDSLRRLTSDRFADVLPAWSPDGLSIAFTTDRFTADPMSLRYGLYRLAFLDWETGEIRAAPFLEDVNLVNPQWSADGASVFFVGDQGGITNVFRLDLGARAFYQVTQVLTGVAGVTRLSPVLSSARRGDVLAYSLFEGGAYHIRTLRGDELRGRRLAQ
jgi:Tol biopolymer transport system component